MGPGRLGREETFLAFRGATFVIWPDELSMRGRTARLARSERRLAPALRRCRFDGRGRRMARFPDGAQFQLGPDFSSAQSRILFKPRRSWPGWRRENRLCARKFGVLRDRQ